MKHKLLNKLWLRVGMIVAVMTTALAGTAWANEETLDFSAQGYSNQQLVSSTTGTVVSATFTNGGTATAYYETGTAIRVYNGGTMTISASGNTITQIVYTYELNGLATATVAGKNSAGEYNSSTKTWTGSDTEVVLTAGTAKHVRISKVVVTYTTSGSSAVATTTTIDYSGITNTDVHTSTAAGSLSASVTAGGNPVEGATVNWSSSDEDVAIVAANGTVTLVAAGTTTITASYAGEEDTYESSSDEYELTVTDSTPIPTHTATFSVNGVTSTQDFEEGATITFPDDPAAISGKTFVGWVTEAIDGTTNVAPSFVTSEIMGQSDVTYYAVFAVASDNLTEVVDVLDRALTGVTSGTTSYSDWSGKTSNSDAVYAGNSAGGSDAIQIRTKNSNSGIVTTTSGGKVKKVVITWNSNTADSRTLDVYGKNSAYSAASDLYSQISSTQGTKLGSIVYGTSTELTITEDYEFVGLRSNADPMYLDEVKITWSTGSVSYSEYSTTVAVATPTFSPAAGTVASGTMVTISTTTAGATIYYTTDDSTPTASSTEYTEPIEITADVTIKAIAVKAGMPNSAVASAAYTIAAPCATPTFSPAAGTYNSAQSVTISCETDDATIYYTTDGSTPTEGSAEYTGAITVGETMTIKAIAVKDGVANSAVAEAAYTISIPSISLNTNSIEATAAGADGTITVTYNNLTDVVAEVQFVEDDGTTAATYDWIDAEINGSDLDYIIGANDGSARTAYMKVYAVGNEGEAYSELITIAQASYVATNTYTLANAITSGKHYVIANGTDGDVRVMSILQNNNNRGSVSGTVSETTLSVQSNVGAAEVVISGPDANGNYTIYNERYKDASDNWVDGGYLYAAGANSNNYLRTEATLDNNNNGIWKIEIDDDNYIATIKAQGSANRNWLQYNSQNKIFSCYSSAQANVYLYEKDGEATPTETVTLNAYGYATYCSQNALDFTSAGVTAWAITDANSTSGIITFSQMTKVPAGTGMLLKGGASQNATLTSLTGAADDVSGNKLVGITAATSVSDNQYYGLSGTSFVKVNAGTVPAGKALLPASEVSAGVKAFTFVFEEDDADGIEGIEGYEGFEGSDASEGIYNLAGQRMNKMQKGINIVNGKKVMK